MRQRRNIADRAIANDADRPAPPRLSAQNLADHRRLGAALSRYDQNVARSDPVDGQENGPKVGRLAQDRDRAPEQARLASGGHKRPDRRINLSLGAPDIDRDGDGNLAPAFDLGVGQIARGDRVDGDSQGSFPLVQRRQSAPWRGATSDARLAAAPVQWVRGPPPMKSNTSRAV